MERNVITPPETQVCKCCGRKLSVSEFSRGGFGLRKTCKECCSKNKKAGREKKNVIDELQRQLQEARLLRLQSFTPRELMLELKRRGYEGTFTYTEVHTIELSKLE